LTKLSESNSGVFPVARLYEVIDGKNAVRAHGPREMPVWGKAYELQLKNIPGSTLSQDAIDAIVRVRILALIVHLNLAKQVGSTLIARCRPTRIPRLR
jgi:hypothetical protein